MESAGDITCYDVTKVTRGVQQRIKINRTGAFRLLPIRSLASLETTSSIQFFFTMSIEAQQHHPLDDNDDDFSPGNGEEKVACVAVRPAANHQPQQGSDEKRAWGLEPHKCQTNQNTRTTRQRWQLWVPWISLAIILYTFIPWESPNLSWLGISKPAMSKPSTRHSPLDDPNPGPNVSCR